MDTNKVLSELTQRLAKAFGDRLVAVVLYGSAATDDFHDKFSDLNVFCVLSAIGPKELEEVEPVFRWWRQQGNPSPLLMSEAEVRRSADCFPIEFHDMQERRRVLHGPDLIAAISIDDRHYRAEVEYQLRSQLLRLRQKAAGTMFDSSLLLGLMSDSVSTFLVIGRHALRLSGDAGVPFAKREIAARLGEALGLDSQPLLKLLDLRQAKTKPRDIDARQLFAQYLSSIHTLVDSVDRIEK